MLTGKTKPGRQGRGDRYQVVFPDATSWVPSDQVEVVPLERETPAELLRAGKLGRAIDLRRTLTHVRLTGRLADVIYSMEATNTDFYPYQFKPVLRFLMSPSNALLIADEVGLGKTIEAGLVWTELRSRFDLRRLVVLCPAVLRDKWRRELTQKMGVDAVVVDAKRLHQTLEDRRESLKGFALICSLQGARPNRNWQDTEKPNAAAQLARFLQSHEHDEPLIDLLVIDEAHYLRNPESQTNELGRVFRAVTENLLLLSATPIHNYNRDLFSLLQLLDADTFMRPDDLEMILDASRPLVEARDQILSQTPCRETVSRLLRDAAGHPLLQGSRQLQLAIDHVADVHWMEDRDLRAQLSRRLETINPLAYVITRTRKRDIKEWRVTRDPVPERVDMHPSEADFYRKVTDFVIDYAMDRDVNERFILATPQRQMSSSMAATLRAWRHRQDNVDEVAEASRETPSADEIGPLTRELIERAHGFGDVEELVRNDSKYHRVRTMLCEYFEQHPEEQVVLFSTYRATLNYLSERLTKDGVANVVMHGGIKKPKEDILREFEENKQVRVLLSSEVGSEGIDLQFCRVLVNYDLPWNPMRVEQRIGRLDRLGQEAKRILIWNLFYNRTIDSRIYERLYEKLNLCRDALGDFEAVLGDEVRKLTTALLSDHLSAEQQESRIDQTAQALANLREEQTNLESEASHLVAYGDYILNEVHAAKELNRWIKGEDLRAYVLDYLRLHYPGCVLQQRGGEPPEYDIELSNAAKHELEQFVRDKRLTPTILTRNAVGPVRCRFENRTTSGGGGRVELVSQFHPLVRFVSHAINQAEEQLCPAVSLRLASRHGGGVLGSGNYLLAGARWSVDGLQATEKLAFTAMRVDGSEQLLSSTEAERLAALCAQHGEDWFEAKNLPGADALADRADEELFGRLEADFHDYVDDVRRQNEDRADLQLKTLERHRTTQLRKLHEVRQRHEVFGRDSLVKATDGRIQALENRIQRKQTEIERRREIRYRCEEFVVAVIEIG